MRRAFGRAWAAIVAALAAGAISGPLQAQSPAPAGETAGSAVVHTAASASAVVENANLALPPGVTGDGPFFGKWRDRPKATRGQVPVAVFLHGSSGLGLAAIEEWQKWLAGIGIASMAPD